MHPLLLLLLQSKGAVGNFGTWQSAVEGFGNAGELKNIRKQLFSQSVPRSKHRPIQR